MGECQTATVEPEKIFMIRFKPLNMKAQSFEAASAAIHEDQLVLRNAKGKPVALFLFDIVESWNEV
jgi:ATP-dependent DNA ligase